MADLTQKQESFCLAYLETGSASEAYRQAYDVAGMKPESVNREAKSVIDNPKISSRIEELRAPVREAAQISLRQHLDDLKRLRDLAEASEKYGPAIQAEVARGKASGLYVEKQEISGPNGGPVEVTRIELVAPVIKNDDRTD